MFLEFHHLQEQPFGVTPDPKFLFWSDFHREALASLFYGIENDRGFMALIAPPGMGKTTLLFQLLEKLRPIARTAFLFQTQCDSRELLRYLVTDLGGSDKTGDVLDMHGRLNDILFQEAMQGRRVVVMIDEAQNLDDSVLETVRLLTDFETAGRKLLQVVLSGQPQLEEKLARPELAQLRQRISIVSRLAPLNKGETDRYIRHRLEVAGHEGAPLFTPGALSMIAARSGGIPRLINNFCFSGLSIAYAKRARVVDETIVSEAAADLELRLRPEKRQRTFSEDFLRRVFIGVTTVIVFVLLATVLSLIGRAKASAPPAMLVATPVWVSSPVPQPPPRQAERYLTVVVQPHDTLREIALRHLGRPLGAALKLEILRLNPQIEDPNLIKWGMQLRLPGAN